MTRHIRGVVLVALEISRIDWYFFEMRSIFEPKKAIPFRAKAVVKFDRAINLELNRLMKPSQK